ncbi:hypothetical protein [Snodgrassella sp. ESL0324]|uniref:hypothetical protein n=1 Tax=Snodgrassella sp. ESL0324 TaxID=2705033 RepID=UPI001582C088|nr:hypothetical protein [Snodgrassella sp. ESL0324]NUF08910.1 hypothetical protein [Snodgrassella sp. ESL0324]
MIDISWEPLDRKLIDEDNLKFPRLYLQKISGDIVLFFTKTKAAFLKPSKNGYELDSVYSGFCECTNDEQWQPIDVVLSNTSLTFGQEVVEINGLAGIIMSSYTDLGDHRIVGQYKFLVLTPETRHEIRNFTGPDYRGLWTYVKIAISHTNGISIVGYQENP